MNRTTQTDRPAAAQIDLQTAGLGVLTLSAVPMRRMPSADPADWLRFQGRHVPGGGLAPAEQERLQAFLRRHRTEAVTDGPRNYTLAGGQLALCDPSTIC